MVQFNAKHVGRVDFTILDDKRSTRRLFAPFLLEETVNFSLFLTLFHPQMFISESKLLLFARNVFCFILQIPGGQLKGQASIRNGSVWISVAPYSARVPAPMWRLHVMPGFCLNLCLKKIFPLIFAHFCLNLCEMIWNTSFWAVLTDCRWLNQKWCHLCFSLIGVGGVNKFVLYSI